MKKLYFSAPFIALIPILVIIPISFEFLNGFHVGGINTLTKFLISAFNPSFDKFIIAKSLHGLAITFSIAVFAWTISIAMGIILALFSSYSIFKILGFPSLIATIIRRLLMLTRATHELIWGLLLLQIFGLDPWIAIIAMVIPYSSLMARIFAEQIDAIDFDKIISIQQTGATKIQVIITAMLPKIIPLIGTYGFYRLECAVRGATLLGVFGLGGIGTQLYLSTLSLNFSEMWTSLWILFIAIYGLEKSLECAQNPYLYINRVGIYTIISLLILLIVFLLSFISLLYLGFDLLSASSIYFPSIISPENIMRSINDLPWIKLILETLTITIFASCIATALPPILLMLYPSKIFEKIISIFWVFCRLFPPPLTSLLLILCTKPSVSVAALALGIQNMGVLGRILKENINKQSSLISNAISKTGSKKQLSWFYGKFTPQSNRYITYSIYRADIILRETVVVGVVGGVGLGWQLQESLSSFAWEEVILITVIFISITLIGESLTEILQNKLHNSTQ